VGEPDKLSRRALELLEAEDSEIFVSPISVAEIACAIERKRIRLTEHWKRWFRHHVSLNQWQVEGIDLEIIEEAYSLPEISINDPVDRILIATARIRHYTILTADQRILSYPHVKAVW